jgi:hypothetical protein
MNAPADRANVSTSSPDLGEVDRETAPAAADQICWIEVSQSPYGPDHQVELLHLQAEADALLLQLQTLHHQRQTSSGTSA